MLMRFGYRICLVFGGIITFLQGRLGKSEDSKALVGPKDRPPPPSDIALGRASVPKPCCLTVSGSLAASGPKRHPPVQAACPVLFGAGSVSTFAARAPLRVWGGGVAGRTLHTGPMGFTQMKPRVE